MPLLGHAWRLSISKEFDKKKKKTRIRTTNKALKAQSWFVLSRPDLGLNLGLNTNGVFITALIKARPKPRTHAYWIHLQCMEKTLFFWSTSNDSWSYLFIKIINFYKKKKKKIHIFVSQVQISHICLNKMLNVVMYYKFYY